MAALGLLPSAVPAHPCAMEEPLVPRLALHPFRPGKSSWTFGGLPLKPASLAQPRNASHAERTGCQVTPRGIVIHVAPSGMEERNPHVGALQPLRARQALRALSSSRFAAPKPVLATVAAARLVLKGRP